jgi:simple sugar transport system substrate-binding protein
MKQGAVMLAPWGPGATPAARAAGDRVKAGIIDGSVQPFAGPISDQSGTLKVPAGSVMTDDEVLKMDWLVQGA